MNRVITISALSILLASCSSTELLKPLVPDQPAAGTGVVEVHSSSEEVNDDPCAHKHGDPQDYCYQNLAVEREDPEICKRVKGERFLSEKKNPPKNKCISMVAAKTCIPSLCENIKKGEFYTPLKCKQRISRLCP
ncbi:MAG: hypothetical protein QF741_03540 [Candidatus Peribacteraceae bacterium]|nr:hypothetical protein [Candidatus Peribacteraceae bacterium]MDP7454332.1 hypothetical protein [Candidatus Peribacteraceae bacterium]MDP7645730.1 hypothetical protein [Candidatus Peribacteraceae bacterium]